MTKNKNVETVKHPRRKATPEQVAAMNRELELRGAKYRYTLVDGRLHQEVDWTRDSW